MRDINFLTENNAKPIWHPMAHPAEMRATPPKIIMKGEGVSSRPTSTARTVLDAVGGLWNVNLGYSCDPIKKAIADAARRPALLFRLSRHLDRPSIELAYELCEWFAPEGMVRAFFTSGGSDSVETALRLARQYWKINGQARPDKIHGAEEGLSRHAFRRRFGQRQRQFPPQLRAAAAGRLPHAGALDLPQSVRRDRSGASWQSCAPSAIEDEIAFQGADTIAAFIMEPVLGAGGVIVPHESFMPLVRAICDRHGILLIADEVVTGFGRTGAWSGSRLSGVKPDMMTIAKAITSGYFPLGATLIGDKVADVVRGRQDQLRRHRPWLHLFRPSGRLRGGACGAGRDQAARRQRERGSARRRTRQGAGSAEGEARSWSATSATKGLMAALELVSDRAAKKPADKKTLAAVADGRLCGRRDAARVGQHHHPVAAAGDLGGRCGEDWRGVGCGVGRCRSLGNRQWAIGIRGSALTYCLLLPTASLSRRHAAGDRPTAWRKKREK